MKETTWKEYYGSVRLILKAELNTKKKIVGINTLAVPSVIYTLNISKWIRNNLTKRDKNARKIISEVRIPNLK